MSHRSDAPPRRPCQPSSRARSCRPCSSLRWLRYRCRATYSARRPRRPPCAASTSGRARPRAARSRSSVRTGTKVSVTATLTGGKWRATCAGKTVAGTSWFRISAINGKTVKSLYGVSYLYAATGLFKAVVPAPISAYAACSTNVRTLPSGTATARRTIKTDTKVSIVATVGGTAWSTTCAGKAVHGSSWYRISAINGTSVRSLYGVSYLYAASGLFKSSPTPLAVAPEAVPDRDPKPTARRPRPRPRRPSRARRPRRRRPARRPRRPHHHPRRPPPRSRRPSRPPRRPRVRSST